MLALRSLEPTAAAASSPTPTEDPEDDDATTVPATTLYAPWAKAQAWLPSWTHILPLPRPDSLLASTSADASTDDPWRVPLLARLWVKKGVAGGSWGLLLSQGDGVVVVGGEAGGEDDGGATGVWVVEPVGEGSDAFR